VRLVKWEYIGLHVGSGFVIFGSQMSRRGRHRCEMENHASEDVVAMYATTHTRTVLRSNTSQTHPPPTFLQLINADSHSPIPKTPYHPYLPPDAPIPTSCSTHLSSQYSQEHQRRHHFEISTVCLCTAINRLCTYM
jgi:hypothetical protein